MSVRARVTRHESALGRFEIAAANAPRLVRPYVREYIGWTEDLVVPLCRRELPTEEVPVIVNFGAPFRLYHVHDPSTWTQFSSFTTGAYDTYQLVESSGRSGGVQLNFTLLGARLFIGQPLRDLTNRAVALEDVFGGPLARQLTGELYDAPTWDARFAILDRVIASRLVSAREVPAEVRCAWHRLTSSRGRQQIGAIVKEIGCSQRHLIERFRDEIGLTPKVFARVLRFGHAVRVIKQGRAGSLTDLALDSGYYDQAHFIRDAREFGGVTPGELVASLLPDEGGFAVRDGEPDPDTQTYVRLQTLNVVSGFSRTRYASSQPCSIDRHEELARARVVAMLPEVDALPGSQRQPAVHDRN